MALDTVSVNFGPGRAPGGLMSYAVARTTIESEVVDETERLKLEAEAEKTEAEGTDERDPDDDDAWLYECSVTAD
jgi:hypothetical protein